MLDHVNEQPVERQKCALQYMGVRASASELFFFKLRQSRYQRLLMNVCCNLNTGQSFVSHCDRISAFFDSDGGILVSSKYL